MADDRHTEIIFGDDISFIFVKHVIMACTLHIIILISNSYYLFTFEKIDKIEAIVDRRYKLSQMPSCQQSELILNSEEGISLSMKID